MTEKDLLKKLNNYKTVQADSTWKEKNREVLLNQISNSSSNVEAGFSFAKVVNEIKVYSDIFYNGIVKNMGQPVLLTSMIVTLVLGGGVVSISASRDTTPGDSLYIAKKISEKTQIALTFDDKKKAQLNVSFAENRAKEIAQVMLDEKPGEQKQEIVEKLTDDFKKEINNVKERIEKIAQKEKDVEENNNNESSEEEVEIVEEEETIFTANLEKGETGLSIGDSKSGKNIEPVSIQEAEKAEVVNVEITTTTEVIVKSPESATSSDNNMEELVEKVEEIKKEGAPESILGELKELIENNDYEKTLEKLSEVSATFDKEGTVKGEEEVVEENVVEDEVEEEEVVE